MRSVTATEARKNWFRLLDEVVQGEVVVVLRRGKKVVLRVEKRGRRPAPRPDYSRLIRLPDSESLDRWSWEWRGPGDLQPVVREDR